MDIIIPYVDPHNALVTISEHLNAPDLHYVCEETILNIPSRYGTGYIRGITFRDGLSLLQFKCTFTEDITLRYQLTRSHPLRLIFCQQGSLLYKFEPDNIEFAIKELHSSFSTSTETFDQYYCFTAHQDIQFTTLEIDRARYIQNVDCELDTIPAELAKVFRDIRAKDPFTYHSNYSMVLADIVQQIHLNDMEGLSRKTFLEARALDLLANIIQLYIDDQLPNHKQVLLRKTDILSIIRAHDIMIEDLSENITIPELAKLAGINSTKLKQGFKKIYDQTINEYMRDRKLDMAKDLILEGSYSIKQIAQSIGYKNYAYFSSRFKERFGALPSEFMRNRRQFIHQPGLDGKADPSETRHFLS